MTLVIHHMNVNYQIILLLNMTKTGLLMSVVKSLKLRKAWKEAIGKLHFQKLVYEITLQ